MAKTIEQLATAATLDGTELVELQQGDVSVKCTTQDIADLGGGGGAAAYLVYTALLSQSGTDAPVATVLQNTLGGTVVWTRNDAGDYTATLADAFTEGKTWLSATAEGVYGNFVSLNFGWDNASELKLVSFTDIGASTKDDIGDGGSGYTSVEIRVYPS